MGVMFQTLLDASFSSVPKIRAPEKEGRQLAVPVASLSVPAKIIRVNWRQEVPTNMIQMVTKATCMFVSLEAVWMCTRKSSFRFLWIRNGC